MDSPSERELENGIFTQKSEMKNKRKKPEKIDVELKECILIAFKKGCMRKAFKTRDYMEM